MTDPAETVTLRVDTREQGRIIKELENLPGVVLERAELDCGDYVAGDLVIERKSSTDFILAIVDQSLYEKAAKLKTRYARCAYIVEGDLFTRRFHQKAFDVHSALAQLTVISQIPVLTSPDAEQTAWLIYFMAAKAQYRLGAGADVRHQRHAVTSDAQRYFLEGLPGVDGDRAERLLSTFGGVTALLAAPINAWQAAADLDDQAAREIENVLTRPWSG